MQEIAFCFEKKTCLGNCTRQTLGEQVQWSFSFFNRKVPGNFLNRIRVSTGDHLWSELLFFFLFTFKVVELPFETVVENSIPYVKNTWGDWLNFNLKRKKTSNRNEQVIVHDTFYCITLCSVDGIWSSDYIALIRFGSLEKSIYVHTVPLGESTWKHTWKQVVEFHLCGILVDESFDWGL